MNLTHKYIEKSADALYSEMFTVGEYDVEYRGYIAFFSFHKIYTLRLRIGNKEYENPKEISAILKLSLPELRILYHYSRVHLYDMETAYAFYTAEEVNNFIEKIMDILRVKHKGAGMSRHERRKANKKKPDTKTYEYKNFYDGISSSKAAKQQAIEKFKSRCSNESSRAV